MPRVTTTGALIAFILMLGGCGGQAPTSAEAPSRPVRTFVFGNAERQARHVYPGRVHADRSVPASFQVGGQIVEFPVSRGQEVANGELLARVDPRDFQNAADAARASWQEAVATRDRYRIAAQSHAVSQHELDEKEAAVRIARAEYAIKRKALEDTEIRAEFDGVVATTYRDNFDRVAPQQAVLELQDTRSLEIHVHIPQTDMAVDVSRQAFGSATARFDVAPGRDFPLRIKEFATEAEPITQTFAVTLGLPNPPDVELYPGMSASVEWVPPALTQSRRQLVPTSAVAGRADGASYVWVVDPNSSRVSRRAVTLGSVVEQEMVEVVAGLEPNETIATAGVVHLHADMLVHELGASHAGLPSVASGPPAHAAAQ